MNFQTTTAARHNSTPLFPSKTTNFRWLRAQNLESGHQKRTFRRSGQVRNSVRNFFPFHVPTCGIVGVKHATWINQDQGKNVFVCVCVKLRK